MHVILRLLQFRNKDNQINHNNIKAGALLLKQLKYTQDKNPVWNQYTLTIWYVTL